MYMHLLTASRYCFMVLTLGLVLVKVIGAITCYQYGRYGESALIEADSRNCLFHRQCILIIINTTFSLYVPTLRVYPSLNVVDQS